MKLTVAIALAAAGLIAGSAHATPTTHTGTSQASYQSAIAGLDSLEAILDIAAGDGLLNEQTRKIVRRVRTPSGWENQITYQDFLVDSPYELAFLNPQGGTPAVESEGQFKWQTSWAANKTGPVDFSVERSGSLLRATLGGLELQYDTAPAGQIDAVGLWISGATGNYMNFDGFLNGNPIAAGNGNARTAWYLFQLDDALELLTGKLTLGNTSAGYPWDSLTMTVKFFSTPLPPLIPEPITIAYIALSALVIISVLRRKSRAKAK